MRAGLVLVPERRDRDGLAFELSVQDNIALPGLRSRGRPWFVGRGWQRAETETATRDLGIRPADPSMLVKQLSGGNQQKVLLAKWMTVGPVVLVLHEPTQAVDVGARRDILQALRRAADSGVSVVLVSSEPDDLVATCDRILVYRSGAGLVDATTTDSDTLIEQIYGRAKAAGSAA
jgi:ribose transport system ATP-binding protein